MREREKIRTGCGVDVSLHNMDMLDLHNYVIQLENIILKNELV